MTEDSSLFLYRTCVRYILIREGGASMDLLSFLGMLQGVRGAGRTDGARCPGAGRGTPSHSRGGGRDGAKGGTPVRAPV